MTGRRNRRPAQRPIDMLLGRLFRFSLPLFPRLEKPRPDHDQVVTALTPVPDDRTCIVLMLPFTGAFLTNNAGFSPTLSPDSFRQKRNNTPTSRGQLLCRTGCSIKQSGRALIVHSQLVLVKFDIHRAKTHIFRPRADAPFKSEDNFGLGYALLGDFHGTDTPIQIAVESDPSSVHFEWTKLANEHPCYFPNQSKPRREDSCEVFNTSP